MLIATIIVVAILTALIFILAIGAFSAILKSARKDIDAGLMDDEIKKEIQKEKKKSSKILNVVSMVFGTTVLLLMLSFATCAVVYRASGEQFAINNKVSLVIVSNSMDGYYNDEYKNSFGDDADELSKDQFAIGDLVTFEKVSENEALNELDVYGYKLSNGRIITHRYIGSTEDGKLIFRGDNTGGRDNYVERSQVILHYTDFKIQRVGYFILFTQSGFGLYSFISVAIIYVLSEIYASRYSKLVDNRLKVLNDRDSRKKIEFTMRNGHKVSFYSKRANNENKK